MAALIFSGERAEGDRGKGAVPVKGCLLRDMPKVHVEALTSPEKKPLWLK